MRARRRQAAGRGSSKERDRNKTNRLRTNIAGHPGTGAGFAIGTAGTGFGAGLAGMGVGAADTTVGTGAEEAVGVTVVPDAVGVTVGVV